MRKDDDDFVEKLSHDSASKSKSVSKGDGKFVVFLPVTPKKDSGSGRERVNTPFDEIYFLIQAQVIAPAVPIDEPVMTRSSTTSTLRSGRK